MKPTLSIDSIPESIGPHEIIWRLENITITYARKDRRWSYELLIWDEAAEDWTGKAVSLDEAMALCDVPWPTEFIGAPENAPILKGVACA